MDDMIALRKAQKKQNGFLHEDWSDWSGDVWGDHAEKGLGALAATSAGASAGFVSGGAAAVPIAVGLSAFGPIGMALGGAVEAGGSIGGAIIGGIEGLVGYDDIIQDSVDDGKDYETATDAINNDTHTFDDQEALENRMSDRVNAHSNKP